MKTQADRDRIKQIHHEIKLLMNRIRSLEDEANRIELGLPHPVKFDDNAVPDFLLNAKK